MWDEGFSLKIVIGGSPDSDQGAQRNHKRSEGPQGRESRAPKVVFFLSLPPAASAAAAAATHGHALLPLLLPDAVSLAHGLLQQVDAASNIVHQPVEALKQSAAVHRAARHNAPLPPHQLLQVQGLRW